MKRSLTKSERLRKKKDISKVFTSGSSFSCKGLKLIKSVNGLEHPRILFSPGRQCSNAIVRNYLKRTGREIVRQMKDRLLPGFDIAFVIYPGDFTYQERQEQFLYLLMKSRSLNKSEQSSLEQ